VDGSRARIGRAVQLQALADLLGCEVRAFSEQSESLKGEA
jgi:hypothetical protein